MSISLMTIITSVLVSSILITIQFCILRLISINNIFNIRLLNIVNTLFILRMIFPTEFGYTITIKSTYILPKLRQFLDTNIISFIRFNITILNLIIFVVIFGAIINMVVFSFKYYQLKKIIALYPIHSYTTISKKHPKNYPIKIISLFDSPAVFGIVHPIVIIPSANFSQKELDYILRHELIHISKFDLISKYIYELLLSVYWWNPLMYVFRTQFNQSIELRTDVLAVENLSDIEKMDYVNLLLKIKETYESKKSVPRFAVPLINTNKNFLLKRAKNIFNTTLPKQNIKTSIILLIIGIFFMTSVVFEPYFINDSDIDDSYSITPENSYLVQNPETNKLDLYIDDIYISSFSTEDLDEIFKSLPIIEKGDR